MAVAVARPTSLASADIELLVVAGGPRWCAAIDLRTGALVSARWTRPAPALAPFSLARGPLAASQQSADPTRPEEVLLSAPPEATGAIRRRAAERWLRPLLHPDTEHLLGSAGPVVPYWTLTGERPSVALVSLASPPAIVGTRCQFRWRHVTHVLPVLPGALAARPPRPRRLLVALTPPRRGNCYKVVAALL